VSDSKRIEAALERRNAMLDAISYAATRIIGTANWKPGMRELLGRLGAATQVSRAFVFKFHREPGGHGLVQSCRFDWAEPGREPLTGHPDYTNMPVAAADGSYRDDWYVRRQGGEVIQVTLSEATGEVRDIFEASDTLSSVSVPIFVNGKLWGALGFDDCNTERVWTEEEIDLLRTATSLIAGAIERAEAELRLRESQAQLLEAQRIAHVGSWVMDARTEEIRWSVEGWRIFGIGGGVEHWSREENLRRIHPDDRAMVFQADTTLLRDGGSYEIQYRIMRPDGEVRVLHERAEAVRNDAGVLVRLVGTVHDITELKATEARLRESEARFRTLADDAPVLLWLTDDKDAVVFGNRRLVEFFGCSFEDIARAGWADRLHPEDRDRVLAARARALRSRASLDLEYRVRRHDGEYRWMRTAQVARFDADGRFAGFVGALRDVTDRKLAEEELVRQRDALHQSEKLAVFGTLLAGVAHELNNPLAVVIAQAAMLEEIASDPAVAGRSARVRRAAERCARIVRTFLAMARQREQEKRPLDLNEVVDMVLDLLGHQLRKSGIRAVAELAPDLPKLSADPDQLHQVITNLVMNACQALSTVPAPRLLRIETTHSPGERTARLSISDNGPGVPPERKERIFEPFFTTKPAGEGTGIGLALCTSIVRAHGGEIAHADTPGGGATFIVTLPLGHVVPEGEPVAPAKSPVALKILVADDEEEICETLGDILRAQGHEADLVSDGRAALARLARESYDLILSDLRMPGLDGRGLYRALKQEHPEMLDRLAFITGDTLSAEIQAFLAETRAACLEKPFLPEDVLQLVASLAKPRE
jgi:PAS domain S-box-containing protein